MDFLKDIKEKTIIICPSIIKNKLLNEINNLDRLINVKLYSLEELKKLVYFNYDINTILYLMDTKGYDYETSKNYIENLYYIEDKEYDNEKLDFLVNLKKELLENNLLTLDKLFLKYNSNIPFIVFGYNYLTSFDKKILSKFNYKVIEKNNIKDKVKVYEFNTLEEELLFVINEIIKILDTKDNINKISLVNLDDNYKIEALKLFKMFNIPIDINNSSSLISTTMGSITINILKETKSFNDTLEYLKKYNKENELEIYSKIVNIFNKYVDLDYSFESILKAIIYDFKNTYIENNNLKNKVVVTSLENNYFNDDEYVFLLGFNQGSIPRIHKDEDYISDKLKDTIGLDTTTIINKLEKTSFINNIKSINNIFISYKKNYLSDEFYPSNLINDSMFVTVKDYKISTEYSDIYSKLKLSNMLDELIKYDKTDPLLDTYYNSLDLRYMDYDNKFKGIIKEDFYKCINKKLTLSYSTIDTFYKCQFRYYLDNILKVDKYEETFDTFIGSLFHHVLSHVYDKDFDLDKHYNDYLKDKTLSNKEKFYTNKLYKELSIICDLLKEFNNDTGLTEVFTEKKLEIDKSTDIEVIFKGIIDKIMYKEYDGKTLISIVDYKTGKTDVDICDSIYGIGMQLLIYLYLVTKKELFNNFSCVGFYLQRILNGEVNIEKDKNYLELKYNNLKLYGYSTDDVLSLSRFDPTYENSKYIRSMKTTKTGFSSYSKVLDEDTMNSLINLVDKKVDEARDKILNCEFTINPKKFNTDKYDEITGCLYCKYQDICFRKNEDIKKINKYKDLSFLKEGDIND